MKNYKKIQIVIYILVITGCNVPSNEHSRELPSLVPEVVNLATEILESAPFNFVIVDVNDGLIETDWEEYPGRQKRLFRWRIRRIGNARYKIFVTPSLTSPQTSSKIRVLWETRERRNANSSWESVESTHGYIKASEILKTISNKINNKNK